MTKSEDNVLRLGKAMPSLLFIRDSLQFVSCSSAPDRAVLLVDSRWMCFQMDFSWRGKGAKVVISHFPRENFNNLWLAIIFFFKIKLHIDTMSIKTQTGAVRIYIFQYIKIPAYIHIQLSVDMKWKSHRVFSQCTYILLRDTHACISEIMNWILYIVNLTDVECVAVISFTYTD